MPNQATDWRMAQWAPMLNTSAQTSNQWPSLCSTGPRVRRTVAKSTLQRMRKDRRFGSSQPSLLHRIEAGHGGDVEDTVGRGGGGTDRAAQFDGTEDFLIFAGCEDPELTAAGTEIDFAVGHHG